jgi:hypothetical protein
MLGLFQAQGAAESDASVRLGVRSHVPGTRRDRAPAEEAGSKKAKPEIETPSAEPAPAPAGESAYGPSSKGVRPMNRLRRTSQVRATLPAAPLRVGVGMLERRRVRAERPRP